MTRYFRLRNPDVKTKLLLGRYYTTYTLVRNSIIRVSVMLKCICIIIIDLKILTEIQCVAFNKCIISND